MISMKNVIKKGVSTASSKIAQLSRKDIVTEGKKSNFLKLVYLEQFIIYKYENIKL